MGKPLKCEHSLYSCDGAGKANLMNGEEQQILCDIHLGEQILDMVLNADGLIAFEVRTFKASIPEIEVQ